MVPAEDDEAQLLLSKEVEKVDTFHVDGSIAPGRGNKSWFWLATFLLGPALALLFGSGAVPLDAEDERAKSMLGLLAWMATWWATETLPLAITALLPVVMLPLLGVMGSEEVAKAYMNDTQMLFLGSFIVAAAVEKMDLHKRLAIFVLLWTGTKPRFMMLGMLSITGFVSMWMSNTATSILMVPLAVTMLETIIDNSYDENNASSIASASEGRTIDSSSLELSTHNHSSHRMLSLEVDATDENIPKVQREDVKRDKLRKFAKGIILCVAYGSTIGGLATMVGTGPNLVLAGYWEQHGDHSQGTINFATWMMFGIPFSLTFGFCVWLFFCLFFCKGLEGSVISVEKLQAERDLLGQMSRAHIFVSADFVVMVVLWVTRQPSLHGWGSVFTSKPVGDGAVSVLAAILLFILPTGKFLEPQKILSWQDCKTIPWDIILLMGGGFALSMGIIESGLFAWLSNTLSILHGMPTLLIPVIVSVFVSAVTEFTSNLASK